MRVAHLSLGDFEIFGFNDGFFYLDGGTMFGVVPKVLWERKCPADPKNRIKLSANCFLVKTPEANIIVETGLGSKQSKKFLEIFSIQRDLGLPLELKKIGLNVEDIDVVFNTHLHYDHCGGNTVVNEEREVVPTFPKAQYIIQRGEWEAALNPEEREKPGYVRDDFCPLKNFGRLKFIEGDSGIVEGVQAIHVPGHTAHHQCLKVQSRGRVLFFLGDLVPMTAHMNLAYVMSFDLLPQVTLNNKRKYYEQSIREGWVLAFDHDPEHYFGQVQQVSGKYEFRPVSYDLSG
jgi:glyoxylase-like metal-dependent hydrolase (beta-lactamase superfamily II)